MSIINTLTFLSSELYHISQNIDNNKYTNLINKAVAQNRWFTIDSIQTSFKAIAESLQKHKIEQWLKNYNLSNNNKPKTIGVVMAGNIPLVGFHDLLCVLISGNNILAKLSSKDMFLYQIIKNILVETDLAYKDKILFTENILKNIDAVIATGSDNSARYFEYYFKKYPNIIRHNRNSLAIITGDETQNELEDIADDIFTYFGLGCRNVSFLFVPENYNFNNLFKAFEKYKFISEHTKYFNNYEYQKAVMLMNQSKFSDNGFVILKEADLLSSPIGVINFKYYKTKDDIDNYIITNKNKIQCIVSKQKFEFKTYNPGTAQHPELWDYADNIDTMNFLINLKQ
jgi:hypothetical protein